MRFKIAPHPPEPAALDRHRRELRRPEARRDRETVADVALAVARHLVVDGQHQRIVIRRARRVRPIRASSRGRDRRRPASSGGWSPVDAKLFDACRPKPWLRQNAVPAAVAARALQSSPPGQSSPASPVGPTMTGIDSVLPNSSMDRSRVSAPCSGRGRSWMSSKGGLVAPERPLVLRAAVGEIEDRARQRPPREIAACPRCCRRACA